MLPILKIQDIIRLKRVNYKSNTTNKAHYVISVRLKGKSSFLYSSNKITVGEGEVVYIPFGSNYSQESDSEEIICIHLDALSPMPKKIMKITPDDSYKVCNLFQKCYQLFNDKCKNYEYLCMSLLYEILFHLNLYEEKSNISTFESALLYLKAHVCDIDLTIHGLCKAHGVSRTYFNKLFKERFGITPTEYINCEKIKKAKDLLLTGSYLNEEISSLCGFNNVKYFYVVFKKVTGMTTKAFRQKG
jgi:YesN/AraC family two-component response regulator